MLTSMSAGIKNLCLLEIFESHRTGKPSFCESFNPRKPKPPYRISIMHVFTSASTGFEAGSSCVGKKAPCSKKTLIAARIATITISQM